MQRFAFLCIFLLAASLTHAQQPILVTEQELDLEGKSAQVLCYHFAEGDRVLLDVTEAEGKALAEVALVAAPGETRWRAQDVAKAEGVEIPVPRAGVYMLRIVHRRGGHRHVHVRIARIPRDAGTDYHETAVQFEVRGDSVFEVVEELAVVGYDSIPVQHTERINGSTEYKEVLFYEEKQHLEAGGAHAGFNMLPWNAHTRARDEKLVAWAFWIGVGEASSRAWEQNKELIGKSGKVDAELPLSPLGALAAGKVIDLPVPPQGAGKDVNFKIVRTDPADPQGFRLIGSSADGVGYGKVSDPNLLQGEYGLLLKNNNPQQAIDVDIRISAYIEVKYWHEQYSDVMELQPVHVQQTVRRFVGMR